MPDTHSIITKISQTKKYRALAPQTIQRIVEETARRYRPSEVENESKKKLHQIWGAYYSTRPNFQKILSKIDEEIHTGKTVKEIFHPLLQIHASTRERMPILDEFYTNIFAITGHPASIIDHAAGLNALTLPWMQLPATTNYTARDIDVEEVMFINTVFKKIPGFSNNKSEVHDLFEHGIPSAQMHFLFKILPLLEQQHKGAAHHILNKIIGKWIIVTYPTASLSGINKGMLQTYMSHCEEIINQENWKHTKLNFPGELVYIIEKN